MPNKARLALMLVALGAIYFIAARLSLTLAFEGSNASAVWPPAGLAIAALALGGLRLAPAITIAAFLANLLSFQDQTPQLVPEHWLAAISIALGNTSAAVFAAWIMRRTPDLPNLFRTQGAAYRLIATIAAASAISAGIGTGTLTLTGIIPVAVSPTVAWTWWLGDLTGALLLTPLILAWARNAPLPEGAWLRWSLLLGLSEFVAYALFASNWLPTVCQRPLTFLIFPVILWAAMREGLRIAALCVLLIAAFAIFGTTRNFGPFAGNSLNDSLILLDTFILLMATITLVSAADRAERRNEGMLDHVMAGRLPYGALLGTLAITIAAWHLLAGITEDTARLRFDNEASRAQRLLERRLNDYARVLRSATGLFAANEQVSRNQWRDYIARLQVQSELPGIQGIGFVAQVTRSQRDALIARVRRDGYPDFTIRPGGEREIYTSIIYIEPFDRRNQRAFGYDMFSEPTRRLAMEHARDSGNPSISARVTLLQEDGQDEQAGFLMYNPVYQRGAPTGTPAERRQALIGYVYSPFRVGDLMRQTLGSQAQDFFVELFDGDRAEDVRRMYSNIPPGKQRPTPFVRTQSLEMMGHPWTLRLTASPQFEAQVDRSKDSFVFLAGALISLLAFAMTRSQSLVGTRAQKLAQSMTVDLQNAKSQLSEREQFASLLFEVAPEALMLSETTGRIVRANQAACSIFGFSAEALLAMNVEDLMPERYRSNHLHLRNGFKRQVASLMGSGRELFARRASGEEFAAEIALAPFQHAGHNYTLISLVDISERRAAEHRLAALSALNTAILDNAAVSIISTDPDGIITSFNYGAEHLLGYRAQEMVGKVTPAIIHDPQEVLSRAEAFSLELGIAIEPGFEVFVAKSRLNLPNMYEWTYVSKTGRRFPVLLSISALRDKQDRITGFLGVGIDITEQKAAQAAVVEKERFLQMVTDTIPGLVGYWDRQLRCRFYNRTYLEWFGRTPEEMPGIAVQELLGEENYQQVRPYMEKALAGEAQHFERTINDREGRTISSFTHYIPDLQHGVVQGFFVLATDISDIKAAQQQLEETNRQLDTRTREAEAASRAKGDFLANMSHEIRTPMNAVIGLSQLLLDTELNAKQRDYLNKVQSASRALLGIINDILDYSKIEAGHLDIEQVDFLVADLTQASNDLFSRQAAEKGITLRFTTATTVPAALRGDPLRLGQILNNLVSNAIKFTERGEIEVMLAADPGPQGIRLRVTVRDTGIGMSPEQTERLFQPFEQADTSTTRKYGGTGLGLSICKRLVELMGGHIGVSSTPGAGSTFHFDIPCALAATVPASVRSLAVQPTTAPARGMRVLLVEDNATNLLVTNEFLQGMGCVVSIARHGAEAVEQVAQHDFDLLLMDLQMPVMDGLTATRIIRNTERGRLLPIVAITAAATREDQEAASAAGMDAHLAKPIDRDKLRAMLVRFGNPAHLEAPASKPMADNETPFALPGLALEPAARRMGGSWSLLREVLLSFHRDFSNAAATLDEDLARGDFSAAMRLVHTVKGLALNIGAETLQQVAQTLETELKSEQAGSRKRFETLLAEALAAIAPLATKASAP
ncbi:MAG TPA: CHASE domain-containing protein, partial [Rhodocyclaceae bacterium]|nr:CHASE domain-containing protein [Rhodocyclaceae bacterium]